MNLKFMAIQCDRCKKVAPITEKYKWKTIKFQYAYGTKTWHLCSWKCANETTSSWVDLEQRLQQGEQGKTK
jgi:hypothetical protein